MSIAAGSCLLTLLVVFGPLTWIKRDEVSAFWKDVWTQ